MKVKNRGRMQGDRRFDGAMQEENREFKKTTTATATPLNKRFNDQNNGSTRVL